MNDTKLYSVYTSTLKAEIKDVDSKKGIVSGYFASFDTVDSDGDIIRKGAFAKTIIENGPKSSRNRIKHLLNHNPTQPLGKLMELEEDTYGLRYDSQVGTHTLGTDFIKMVESGLITEHSIGYRIIKRNQLNSYEQYMENPSKGWFELTELKLYEGSSLTHWGANEFTPLTGLKSMADVNVWLERQKAIEKFCRNSDASDELIETLLLHSKQLTQYILSTPPPTDGTEPGKIAEAIKQFTNELKSK